MRNRDWVHTVDEEERRRRNAAMVKHLEQRLREMENWTEEECRRLKMTSRAREAAERAWRQVVLGRRYLLLPKHTPPERRFLRMMIKLMIAENPGLVERAVELARYLSASYPFEWLISPCTRLARADARALLLQEAETEFGETPLARQVAYAQYHWQQLRIRDVANLGEVYAMALFLDQHSHFLNPHEEWRVSLGLHRHALQRELRARAAQHDSEEPAAPASPKPTSQQT
jgi:hypothetical protein